jgi:hypothetical protein
LTLFIRIGEADDKTTGSYVAAKSVDDLIPIVQSVAPSLGLDIRAINVREAEGIDRGIAAFSTPDRRTRRALLHLSYSCAPPFGPAILVTQDPFQTSPRANFGARATRQQQ